MTKLYEIIGKLYEEVAQLREDALHLAVTNRGLESKLAKANEELEVLRTGKEVRDDLIAGYEKEIEKLKNEACVDRDALKIAHERERDLKKKVEELETKIDSLEWDIEDLQNENEDLKLNGKVIKAEADEEEKKDCWFGKMLEESMEALDGLFGVKGAE
jgi:chromosome segregation ATPase